MSLQDQMKAAMAGFFPEYYLERYADLRNAFGNDQKAAWRHYLEYGIGEGRSATPFFDPIFYRDIHPDLHSFDGAGLLDHWVKYGILEGRRGSTSFWIGYYLQSYPDLQQAFGTDLAAAFDHWQTYGNVEARRTAPGRILRLHSRYVGGDNYQIVAREGAEQEDPELFQPWNTTGGQIGFGIGLVVGTIYGNPGGGAVVGSLIGHGLDRVVTRVSNDITGPFWRSLEQGPPGLTLGNLLNQVSSIPAPNVSSIPFPRWPF